MLSTSDEVLSTILGSFGDNDAPPNKTASFIGIIVSISGNVLISLALNTQKLAHRRLEAMSDDSKLGSSASSSSHTSEDILLRKHSSSRSSSTHPNSPLHESQSDTAPLQRPRGRLSQYGSLGLKLKFPSRRGKHDVSIPIAEDIESLAATRPVVIGIAEESRGLLDDASIHEEDEDENEFDNSDEFPSDTEDGLQTRSESAYLKSKLWWLGFALMNLGELGNFLSYAYAPASVVAPLGAFALIANCLFAPVMLKEQFRKRDLLGLALCICGALTVVLGGKTSDVRLDPEALIRAISQRAFIIYTSICVAAASVFAFLSDRPLGREHVWIDLGLCALFGGYTVLSTKGISTLLSLEWIQIYQYWITYPLVFVLVATGVGQIRYLNRALMKFDSKVVIPTQFVLFNFSAIIGSAILYGDFRSMPFERMVIFLYGCATTFLGVFILASPTSTPIGGEENAAGDVGIPGTSTSVTPTPSTVPNSGAYPFPPPSSSTVTSSSGPTPVSSSAINFPASAPGHAPPQLRTSVLSNASGTHGRSHSRTVSHSSGGRVRASSTAGLGLSSAQYLLLATGTTPPAGTNGHGVSQSFGHGNGGIVAVPAAGVGNTHIAAGGSLGRRSLRRGMGAASRTGTGDV